MDCDFDRLLKMFALMTRSFMMVGMWKKSISKAAGGNITGG